MSELTDLETAVVTLLRNLTLDGGPAFATVRGFADAGRRRALDALARQNTPAALVLCTGRTRTGAGAKRVARLLVSVLIANRNLGGGDRVRLGDEERPGSFRLLQCTMQALDGAVALAGRRLVATNEQIIAADDRVLVHEQQYYLEQPA